MVVRSAYEMKFSTPFLFLKNVAYDPLIRNFLIYASVQRGKEFFFRGPK